MRLDTSGIKKVTTGSAYKSLKFSEKFYRGFSTVNSTGSDNFSLYDFELIKQDIINHFHIRQGENLANPRFGTVIWDLLFEPFTDNVREAILDNVTEIINYDPRVQVNEVIVDSYETGISINCVLTYLPYNMTEQMYFNFDQSMISE